MKKHSGRHDIKLTSIEYKDKDTGSFMYYIPALEITGYGDTRAKAEEMSNFTLTEFLKMNSKEIAQELEVYNFIKTGKNKKGNYEFKEPKLSEMIKKNKDLNDIVNHNSYERKFQKAIIFI